MVHHATYAITIKKYKDFAGISRCELLGDVGKFEPVSTGGIMGHTEEAVGELSIPSCDGPVDLEMTEHAFDAVPLLVERPVMFDFHTAV